MIKKVNSYLSKCICILEQIIKFDNVMCNDEKYMITKNDISVFFYMREHSWYWFLVCLENVWELLGLHKDDTNQYKNNLNLLINKLNIAKSTNDKLNEEKLKLQIYTYIFEIVKNNIFFYLNLELILKKHEAQFEMNDYIYSIDGPKCEKAPFLTGKIKYYWFFILMKIRDYFLSGNNEFIDELYNSKAFQLKESDLCPYDIDIKNGLNNQFLNNMCETIFWPDPSEYFRSSYGQHVLTLDEQYKTILDRMNTLKNFLIWLKNKINNNFSYVENNKFNLFKLFLEEKNKK